MKNLSYLFLILIFMLPIVVAVDLVPNGNINGRGVYSINNFTSLSLSLQSSQICFGTLCGNWTNLTSAGTSYTADDTFIFLTGSTFSFNETRNNQTIRNIMQEVANNASGWTNTSVSTHTDKRVYVNSTGTAHITIEGLNTAQLNFNNTWNNFSISNSFGELFTKQNDGSNRSFIWRGRDNVDIVRFDLLTDVVTINTTLRVTGLNETNCDLKAYPNGTLYCGTDGGSNETDLINAVNTTNNIANLGFPIVSSANFTGNITVDARLSNETNGRFVEFITNNTNQTTAFLTDLNSGLLNIYSHQTEIFAFSPLIINGRRANSSRPTSRNNAEYNYATTILSELASMNNRTLQVRGGTNTTYLIITNNTAANCDLKADTSGNVYCGTDGGGGGSVTGTGTAGELAVWVNSTHLGDNANQSVIMNFTNTSNILDIDTAYTYFNFLKNITAPNLITSIPSTYPALNITSGYFAGDNYNINGSVAATPLLHLQKNTASAVAIRFNRSDALYFDIILPGGTSSEGIIRAVNTDALKITVSGSGPYTVGDIIMPQDVYIPTSTSSLAIRSTAEPTLPLEVNGSANITQTLHVGNITSQDNLFIIGNKTNSHFVHNSSGTYIIG